MNGDQMKTKMALELPVKIILGLVSLILLGYIIKLSMDTYRKANAVAGVVSENLDETYDNLRDYDFNQLDGEKIEGSRVVNLIKKYLGDYKEPEQADIYFHVVTKASDDTYYNISYLEDIKNFTKARYIKPSALFLITIDKNNDAILGVSCIQQ